MILRNEFEKRTWKKCVGGVPGEAVYYIGNV